MEDGSLSMSLQLGTQVLLRRSGKEPGKKLQSVVVASWLPYYIRFGVLPSAVIAIGLKEDFEERPSALYQLEESMAVLFDKWVGSTDWQNGQGGG